MRPENPTEALKARWADYAWGWRNACLGEELSDEDDINNPDVLRGYKDAQGLPASLASDGLKAAYEAAL